MEKLTFWTRPSKKRPIGNVWKGGDGGDWTNIWSVSFKLGKWVLSTASAVRWKQCFPFVKTKPRPVAPASFFPKGSWLVRSNSDCHFLYSVVHWFYYRLQVDFFYIFFFIIKDCIVSYCIEDRVTSIYLNGWSGRSTLGLAKRNYRWSLNKL